MATDGSNTATIAAARQADLARFAAAAQAMEDNRITASTKKQYESKIKKLKEFLITYGKHEELDDSFKYGIRCPMQFNTLKEFLGTLVPIDDSQILDDQTVLSHQPSVRFADLEEEEEDDDGQLSIAGQSTTTTGTRSTGNGVSESTFGNYLSAITYLYTQNGVVEASKLINGRFKGVRAGLKRKRAAQRDQGLLPAMEGKAPLSFTGYSLIADYAFHESGRQQSFCWVYALLCWNLISRSNDVGKLKLQQVSWSEDAMVVIFPRTKGDQEGDNAFPRHVYANPYNPMVCPILAMAVHIFSGFYEVKGENMNLFAGTSANANFSSWLTAICARIETDVTGQMTSLTAVEGGVGSHSFRQAAAVIQDLLIIITLHHVCDKHRKGGATYALSFPGGPNTIGVFLRASWSIGATPGRYIFMGDGSDQFVGRVVAGLPLQRAEFAVLPPHFDDDYVVSEEKVNGWLLNYAHFPECFKSCVPYLLASLVYHYQFLQEHLPSNHRLRRSSIWTSGDLRSLSAAGKVSLNPSVRMNPTGVPLGVLAAVETQLLRKDVFALSNAMRQYFETMQMEMHNLRDDLPSAIADVLEDRRLVSEDAVPVSERILREHIAASETRLEGRLREMFELLQSLASTNVGPSGGSSAGQPTAASLEEDSGPTSSWNHIWGGRMFNPVPMNFQFPFNMMTVKPMWDLWVRGLPAEKHRPYRLICPQHLVHPETKLRDRQYLSRAKKVMNLLLSIAIDVCKLCTRETDLQMESCTDTRRNEVFMIAYGKLLEKIEERRKDGVENGTLPKKIRKLSDRSIGELKVCTLYDDITELKISVESF